MSFLNSLQQVVAGVTSSVSNLTLSPKRFPFGRETPDATPSPPPTRKATSRLGPKLVPTPGAPGSHGIKSLGRGKPPSQQKPIVTSPQAKREKRPLPVLHCGDRYTYWPEYDPSQNWVSEKDGNWLEQFTSLGWRHNESIQSLKAQTLRQGSKDVTWETLACVLEEEDVLGKAEMESLYVEVLYTVKHKVGAPLRYERQDSLEDLMRYAQKAFHISPDDHARLMAVAQEEKAPILVLNLVVIEADGLEAKDPNGYSDPFCMVGIVPSSLLPVPVSQVPLPQGPLPQGPPPSATMAAMFAAASSLAGHPKSPPRETIQQSSQEGILPKIIYPARIMTNTASLGDLKSLQEKEPLSVIPTKGPNDGFSDPYCMLGIQPAYTILPGSPRDSSSHYLQGSPPPDSPRYRQQLSKGDSDIDSDACLSGSESPKPFAKDNLRKHHSMARLNLDCLKTLHSRDDDPRERLRKRHSFRLSFKRKPFDGRREQRDSLSNAIPAKIIRATSVRPHTLNPKWNEKFRLDIEDITTDILHLDIWDHDDEACVLDVVSKLNEVKGVKGLGRFFKQIAQSARSGGEDDFLGCVNLPLQDIPSTGVESWYKLEGRSTRSNIQGQIHLKMWLSTREDRGMSEEEIMAELVQHDRIISIFLHSELSRLKGDIHFKDDSINWDGAFLPPAESILLQHAIQGDLTNLQKAVCRWMAYIRVHVSKPLDHRIIHRQLVILHDLWDQETLSSEEEELLAKSYNQFLDHGLKEIRRHREIFPTPSKTHSLRLEALLKCLALLNESRSYWKVRPFHKDVRGEVIVALRTAAHEWYDSKCDMKLLNAGLDVSFETLAKIALQLAIDLQTGLDYLEHAFLSNLNLHYVDLAYRIIEKRPSADSATESQKLCALLREMELSHQPSPMACFCPMGPFLLYLALAEISSFQESVPLSDRRYLALPSVWGSFYPAMRCWIDVAAYQVLCRIRNAILTDRVANTGEPVQYTTSAVDTTSSFYLVKTFWRHLAWPDPITGYELVLRLIQLITTGADYYVHLLQQRLQTLSPETTLRERTQQLCITVNNMEHVRHSFMLLEDELQIRQLLKALELQDPRNASAYEENLICPLSVALSDLDDKITASMIPVAEKINVDLQRDVFHLAWSPDTLPAIEAVRPLLERLHNSLTHYAAALLKNNLDRLLFLLWRSVLLALLDKIERDTEEKQKFFFVRLYDALGLLRDFFAAAGKGLNQSVLQGPEYLYVEEELRLHKSATDDLMDSYHLNRLCDQEQCDSQEFGNLSVRAYFNHDSLCIEILQAKNMIPLDPNGLSDPFVVIELLPRRLFPGCGSQQTNVHKRTLNPLFDECFEFPATLDSCRSKGAMILFTLMDHDVITCNDFGGEAFLSLNTIPGVVASSSSLDNFHGLKAIELNLMFRKEAGDQLLRVLESRKHDRIAQEFVKKQKQRLKPS